MSLPIDRTAKTTLDGNLINGNTSDAPAIKANNDVLYNGNDELYNYVLGLIAGGVLQPYPAFLSRQALINGNFDVWQRITNITNPPATSFIADRYVVGLNADGGILPLNIIHSKQTLTAGDIPNSYYFYRVNVDGAGSAYGVNSSYRVSQKIENGVRYLCGANKKVTVSFWARSTITNKKIGINLFQLYGSGGSPAPAETINGTKFVLTSAWAKYTYTFATNTLVGKTFGTNNDDVLQLVFNLQWGINNAPVVGDTVTETFGGAGNIDIAQVQVNSGDQALPFQPRDLEDETRKSIRYAWVPQTNSVFIRLTSYTANTLVFDVPLPVQMRVSPTIRGTVNSDIIAYTVAGVAQTGFTASVVLNSHGVTVSFTKTAHGLTDGYLEIKATSGFDAEM